MNWETYRVGNSVRIRAKKGRKPAADKPTETVAKKAPAAKTIATKTTAKETAADKPATLSTTESA